MIDIKNFLNSEEGRNIVKLTDLFYNSLEDSEYINVIKHHSIVNHLDVIYFQFCDYDLFVFQGTSCLIDCIADIKMALGIKPKQFRSALKFVKKHLNKEVTTYISGHSLGGAIAQYVVHSLDKDNIIGVTFNGAGSKHLIKLRKNKYSVLNYISSKDILNNITKILPFSYFKHLGETLIVEDKESKNGVKSHSNFNVFKTKA